MKRMITLAMAVALCIGLAATPSMAADATLSLDAASSYVWRGITFNDGMVLQPSIDVAAENGLGINVWGNFDIDDYDNQLDDNEFSEVDFTVSYSKSVGKLDISGGLIEYLFPTTDVGGVTATTEVFLSLGYPIIAGLSASLDVYYDVDAFGELAYANLGIAYGLDITDKLSAEAGVSFGYAGEEFAKAYGTAAADAGPFDLSVSASASYAISDAISASAFVTFVDTLDDDNLVEGNTAGTLDSDVYGGVSVGYAF